MMKIKKFFRQVFCRHELWELLPEYSDIEDDFAFRCIRCGKLDIPRRKKHD